jgi:hypothetical protein
MNATIHSRKNQAGLNTVVFPLKNRKLHKTMPESISNPNENGIFNPAP